MAAQPEQPDDAVFAASSESDTRRCMPVQPPGCFPRRPRRYNPDNPPPPRPPRPTKTKNTVVLKPGVVTEKQEEKDKAPSVPVFGVQLMGGGEATLEDMATMLIERARLKQAAQDQRPSWDSSWKVDTSEMEQEVGGCLTDVAGVTVCGIQPIGRQSNSKLEDASSSFSVVSCGASLRDVVANAEPLPSVKSEEERESILRRLLNLNSDKPDTKGLIRRFEPSGGKLYVSDKDRAMSKAWLGSNKLLGGRAVRCLHQVAGEEYPPMRALCYEVNDALYEPILGYFSPAYGSTAAAAQSRRQEVKGVLDFIHEGIVAGEAVVVHCRLGTNRSVVVAAAYLMIYHRVRCEDALALVEARGPSSFVVRQPAFTEQLLRLEREIAFRSREVAVSHWRHLHEDWADVALGLPKEDGDGAEGEEAVQLPAGSAFMMDKLAAQQHITLAVAMAEGAGPPNTDAAWGGVEGNRGVDDGGAARTEEEAAGEEEEEEGVEWGQPQRDGVWLGEEEGAGGAGRGERECVSGMVEVLEGQIWHAKVLSMERRGHGNFVLCVVPPPHQDSEQAGVDLCLRLRGAVVEAVGDKEMIVRSGGKSVRVLMDTEDERERFVQAAVDMAERAWSEGLHKGEEQPSLAELDETGEDGAVAHRVHVVHCDDDEEEVWI